MLYIRTNSVSCVSTSQNSVELSLPSRSSCYSCYLACSNFYHPDKKKNQEESEDEEDDIDEEVVARDDEPFPEIPALEGEPSDADMEQASDKKMAAEDAKEKGDWKGAADLYCEVSVLFAICFLLLYVNKIELL